MSVGSMVNAIWIVVQLSLLLWVVLAAGCSDREQGPREPRGGGASGPEPVYEPIQVRHGGTVTGTVTWSGPRPEPVLLPVPHGSELCGTSQPLPALTLGRRGGIADTVLWLEDIQRGRPVEISPEPIAIVLEGCAFRPHIVAAPVGAAVTFRSGEPLLHNVRGVLRPAGRPEEELFSRALPEPGAMFEIMLDRAGVIRLVDDAGHPWLLAWIHVFSHPYFTVSDRDGRFQLTRIPAGQYILRAWHEGVRLTGETEAGRPVYSAPIALARPVTVTAGHDTTVDFVITPEIADAAGD